MARGGKLPYIPDKKLYAAVMGACSYIRETGWFNKTVNYYADKYDVNPDDVAKYVRMAQSAGQKRANASKPKRKYYWFAVEYSRGSERYNGIDFFYLPHAEYEVCRGMSEDTVRRRLEKNEDLRNEYCPLHWFGRIERFETQEEAKACTRAWKREAASA